MEELKKDIRRAVKDYFDRKTEAYIFRDNWTKDNIEGLVNDFEEDLIDILLKLDHKVDKELEEAELNYEYFNYKETYRDMEDFIHYNQM